MMIIQFILGFALGIVHCMHFDECIMTFIQLYSLIQSGFKALNILWDPPT